MCKDAGVGGAVITNIQHTEEGREGGHKERKVKVRSLVYPQ